MAKVKDTKQIVVAWVNEEMRIALGPAPRIDLGERHRFETVKVGAAAMWLRRGTADDVEKARAYAKTASTPDRQIYVFTYDHDLKNPLAYARLNVLDAAK